MKAQIFEAWGGTTHWPHENINPRLEKAIKADGTVDPLNRDEPFVVPEKSEKLLKLAGAMPY